MFCKFTFPPDVVITMLSKKSDAVARKAGMPGLPAIVARILGPLFAPGAIITAAILDNVATLSIPGLTGDTFITSSQPVVIVELGIVSDILARWRQV